MNNKISVIIPVYNVEPSYIDKAVNSVLDQTYKNIEIIIVNDGSTNNETIRFLDSLDNPLIRIINQENKGLGGARNTGIENSTGDYIGFLDSDDWLDKNYYEVLYNLCEENDADIACATLTKINSEHQKLMDKFSNTISDNFLKTIKYITNGSTCSKLFKKELFSDIKFREKTYYEDNPILIKILLKSKKVAFTNKVKYYYRENPTSICLDPNKEKQRKIDQLIILKDICEIIKDQSDEIKDIIFSIFIPILCNGRIYCTDKKYKDDVNNLIEKNYRKYIVYRKNTFLQNIFSVKNSFNKTHKIITVLWIKIKIKRKNCE